MRPALQTLLKSEWTRFLGILGQSVFPAIVTNILYLLIIGLSIGQQVELGIGVSYLGFLVPGLIMMGMISNAFSGGSGSLFFQRFLGHITNLLTVPLRSSDLIIGYIFGGLLRGFSVGLATWIVTLFFVRTPIHNLFIVLYFSVTVMVLFSCLGVIVGLMVKQWEHLGAMTTFIITPLTFFGGVFHSITLLPHSLQILSRFNPFLYMVSGLRYGFIGYADVSLYASMIIVFVCMVVSVIVSVYLFRIGYNLRT